MIAILVFVVLPIYVFLCVRFVRWHKDQFGEPKTFISAIVRSLVKTLCYGVGIMGTQGFALPAPLLPAMIFNDYNYWLQIAFIPFLFWFTAFSIGEVLKWLTSRNKSSNDTA